MAESSRQTVLKTGKYRVHTLAIVDGFGPGQPVVEPVVCRCRRAGRGVPQSDRNAHELDVALRVVPDEQLDAGPQVAASVVVDLAVGLDRHQVLLGRVPSAVDVRHPVAAGASAVDKVA